MTTAQAIQRGCGKGRNPWKIRECLANAGTSMREIADENGINYTIVRETVYGLRNHEDTLKLLKKHGCSDDLLYPGGKPKNKQGEKAA